MELGILVLSKIIQIYKYKYCMFSLTCRIYGEIKIKAVLFWMWKWKGNWAKECKKE